MTNVAKDKLIFKLTKWTICPSVNVLYIFSEHLLKTVNEYGTAVLSFHSVPFNLW